LHEANGVCVTVSRRGIGVGFRVEGTMSLICSPVPTKDRQAQFARDRDTMPPLAVPSSFVRMIPVTATVEVNSRPEQDRSAPWWRRETNKTSAARRESLSAAYASFFRVGHEVRFGMQAPPYRQ